MEPYVVTLWNHTDLDDFYDDMETPGGSLYIPDRECECCKRKPISRNTHYMLTAEEAEQVSQDERVRSVVLRSEIPKFTDDAFTRSGTYDKNWANAPAGTSSRNWSLWRSRNTYNDNSATIDGWYPDGPMSAAGENPLLSSSITQTETGKNVDIIFADGPLDPNHPDAAVNEDGTGGTRVVEYDWNQHTVEVGGSLTGAYSGYVYENVSSSTYNRQINHGSSCASQAAGSQHGHAPGANIYSIWPYDPAAFGLPSTFDDEIWDYIRAFHNNKSVNPATGVKNPTIVNASIGFTYTLSESGSRWPYYAQNGIGNTFGQFLNTSYKMSNAEMEAAEICAESKITGTSPNRSADISGVFGWTAVTPVVSEIEDMIADGIHFFKSAGNSNNLSKVPGTTSWLNTYMLNGFTGTNSYNNGTLSTTNKFHYHGKSFCPPEGITVGAISGSPQGVLQSQGKGEMPIYYTVRGEGVDIYAFCDFTDAAVNNNGLSVGNVIQDGRNASYYIRKFNGTSSACPQAVGMAACILERYPDMSPADLKEYILASFTRDKDNDNEVGDDGRGWPGEQPINFDPFSGGLDGDYDNYSFAAGENPKVMMYLKDLRTSEGRVGRDVLHRQRRSSGAVYPRARVARTYRT